MPTKHEVIEELGEITEKGELSWLDVADGAMNVTYRGSDFSLKGYILTVKSLGKPTITIQVPQAFVDVVDRHSECDIWSDG